MKLTVIDHLHALHLSVHTDHSSLTHCNEHLFHLIPDFHGVMTMRNLGSDVFLVDHGGVVRGNEEVGGRVLADRAVKVCAIESLTPLPVV